jgi:osmotically-inducible protein OsmY
MRTSRFVVFVGVMFGTSVLWTSSVNAGNATAQPQVTLEPIMVTAKRTRIIVPDEVLKDHIEAALHDDPNFLDSHVEITVKNGVAYLEGIVFDDWDATHAKRIARRIPGVRRVVADFYIPDGQ